MYFLRKDDGGSGTKDEHETYRNDLIGSTIHHLIKLQNKPWRGFGRSFLDLSHGAPTIASFHVDRRHCFFGIRWEDGFVLWNFGLGDRKDRKERKVESWEVNTKRKREKRRRSFWWAGSYALTYQKNSKAIINRNTFEARAISVCTPNCRFAFSSVRIREVFILTSSMTWVSVTHKSHPLFGYGFS